MQVKLISNKYLIASLKLHIGDKMTNFAMCNQNFYESISLFAIQASI